MEQILPVLMTLAVVVVAFVLIGSNLRKYREYLLPLSRQLENATIEGKFNIKLVGRYSGYDVRVEPHQGGKNTPPFILVRLYKKSSLTFTVTPEGTVARLFKRLGLVKEIEVGDPGFDQRFVLRVSDEMTGRMFFSNNEVRDAVDRVFQSGYQHLLGRKGELFARKKTGTFQMEADLRPEMIVPVLDALVTLAKYLP